MIALARPARESGPRSPIPWAGGMAARVEWPGSPLDGCPARVLEAAEGRRVRCRVWTRGGEPVLAPIPKSRLKREGGSR